MWRWLHKFASPPYFYHWSGKLLPWLGWSCLLLLVGGWVHGLVFAPIDDIQGNSYRIIFVHVPAAWMSLFVYLVMAFASALALVWHLKLAEIIAASSAPIGASFTALALITGSLWGKPTWGTWWQWDGRLTSELILLFLYLGFMALQAAIDDRRTAARASGILALVGVVNIPIIHYSVIWWNTLHQAPSVAKLGAPSIHISMLIPLLVVAVAFKLYYGFVVLIRARAELLARERHSAWVKERVDHG